MAEDIIGNDGIVVRVLGDTDIRSNGHVKPNSFKLRDTEHVPHEEYISVFRESVASYRADVADFCKKSPKKSPVGYCMEVGVIRSSHFENGLGKISFDVKPVPTFYLSHAGIFIAIDGHFICGGEISKAQDVPVGEPLPPELLEIRGRLARIADASQKVAY